MLKTIIIATITLCLGLAGGSRVQANMIFSRLQAEHEVIQTSNSKAQPKEFDECQEAGGRIVRDDDTHYCSIHYVNAAAVIKAIGRDE